MKRSILLLILMLMCSPLVMLAQKITVTGQLLEKGVGEPMAGASVVLLQPKDSAQVTGAMADANGVFKLTGVKKGQYIMRVSYMGYRSIYRNVLFTKDAPEVKMGVLEMEEDTKVMKEAEVVARVAQVEVKADTFVYNAAAFRTPEGAALEELVRKLPGAEVEDDGTIKINGKTVSKIMVDGKEFFANDTKMTMKNLPAKAVEKLKAYERKSDYTRVTGIDDGEEETVLDLSVKKGMKDGWLSNIDVAYGTEDRYSAKVNVQRFEDNRFMMGVGSINNVNDQGFPGGGGRRWGGGGGGIVTSKMGGLTFAWENGKKEGEAGLLKMGGSVRYSHNKNDNETRSNSETFLGGGSSTFSNSWNKNLSKNANVNVDLQLEWKPDSMTNIIARPSFSHSEGNSHGENKSATFNEDPYKVGGMTDPLEEYKFMTPPLDSIRVNGNDRFSRSDNYSNNFNFWGQFNRRLNKPGRNITFDLGGNYSASTNNSYSRSLVNLFKQDSTYATYQDTHTPAKNYNVRGRLSYNEPIAPFWNLQGSYQFQYRFQDSDRTMMTYEDYIQMLKDHGVSDSEIHSMDAATLLDEAYLRSLGIDESMMIQDWQNSQYATYKEYNHDAGLMIRYNKGENRFNAGFSFQPQTTHMDYLRGTVDTTVVRHTFNWSPRVDYRWKISGVSQLRARFNGRMNQPSMTNLLEVIDSSDPLNISTGNPGLRSSWSNNFNIDYNGYYQEKQMSWVTNAWFGNTQNSIANATIYNRETGGRYSRPMNISGNWNVGTWMMFGTAIDKKKMWNFNTNLNVNYSNNVGYLSSNITTNIFNPDGTVNMNAFRGMFDEANLEKSITKNTNVGQTVRFNFRNDLLEVGVNGSYNYMHGRNDKQPNANLDTWTFNYGANLQLNFDWGMSFTTDISQQSRRGYSDASMNTNELIWNAQISQTFLKKKEATISVQWYDILRNRSNISRNLSAISRTDTWSNAIHSYVMVHFIYRLNLLGSKEMRVGGQGGQGGPGGFGGGYGGGGWGGGRGGRF